MLSAINQTSKIHLRRFIDVFMLIMLIINNIICANCFKYL